MPVATTELIASMFTQNFISDFTALISFGEWHECWLWQGRLTNKGYGQVTLKTNSLTRSQLAHRVAWAITHEGLAKGPLVLHNCDTPPCVNPCHLYLGDALANKQDACARGLASGGSLRGELSPRAKLTAPIVFEILQLLKETKLTYRAIAAQYGVSDSAIHQILNGRNWSWLR